MRRLTMFFVSACLLSIFVVGGTAEAQGKGGSDLEKDIQAVSLQIDAAEKENVQYSGGLVKSLIILRLQILKNTKVMLEQKKYALKHGIPVKYTCKGEIYQPTPADQTAIQEIESDIRNQEAKLSEAEVENAKYSGGLVKAMILSQISTIKNTIAMLEQRKLTAKYGIPLFAFAKEEPATTQIKEESVPEVPPVSKTEVEIIDVDAKVTESNPTWWKYAWRLTIKNSSSSPIVLDATIDFQDKDGFIVDDDTEYNIYVPAGEQKTFTGYQLIDASVARNVAKIAAKVRQK